MVLTHSNLARQKAPSVPQSHLVSRSPIVAATLIRSLNELPCRASGRQKNMADSLWPVGSSWQHVAIAGNVPNEGKNYEPEICQRGSEALPLFKPPLSPV